MKWSNFTYALVAPGTIEAFPSFSMSSWVPHNKMQLTFRSLTDEIFVFLTTFREFPVIFQDFDAFIFIKTSWHVVGPFLAITSSVDTTVRDIASFFQIWSTLAGYEEITGVFEPNVENVEKTSMYNNEQLLDDKTYNRWFRISQRKPNALVFVILTYTHSVILVFWAT